MYGPPPRRQEELSLCLAIIQNAPAMVLLLRAILVYRSEPGATQTPSCNRTRSGIGLVSHTRGVEPEKAACRRSISGSSVVAVMQPAQASLRDHPTLSCGSSPTRRCLLAQPEMGPVVMVVGDVIREEPLEMVLIQRNHLVEQLAAAASQPALGYAILPRTLNRSLYSRDLHRANCCRGFQIHTLRRDHR